MPPLAIVVRPLLPMGPWFKITTRASLFVRAASIAARVPAPPPITKTSVLIAITSRKDESWVELIEWLPGERILWWCSQGVNSGLELRGGRKVAGLTLGASQPILSAFAG